MSTVHHEVHADIEPLLQAPDLAPGLDTQMGIVHDMAHIIVGAERGINFTDGIRSHLHPENPSTGAVMSAPIDWTPFLDENGDVDPTKMKNRISDIAATYVAGGVANDLYHDIPIEENPHVEADMDILTRFLKRRGLNEADVSKVIARGLNDAAQIVTQPGVRDVLEQHASVREAGLDKEHHISQKRMQQILKDVERARKRQTSAQESFNGKRHEEKVRVEAKKVA